MVNGAPRPVASLKGAKELLESKWHSRSYAITSGLLDYLIEYVQRNRGKSLPLNEIAGKFGVTRSTVWLWGSRIRDVLNHPRSVYRGPGPPMVKGAEGEIMRIFAAMPKGSTLHFLDASRRVQEATGGVISESTWRKRLALFNKKTSRGLKFSVLGMKPPTQKNHAMSVGEMKKVLQREMHRRVA